jgi:predicted Zn-dependent protease
MESGKSRRVFAHIIALCFLLAGGFVPPAFAAVPQHNLAAGQPYKVVHSPAAQAVYATAPDADYLNRMEGRSRWPDGHLIKVYVAPGRPSFAGIVASCFDQWSKAASDKIAYTFVESPRKADYVIKWTARQHEAQDGTEAGLTTTDTYLDDANREFILRAHTNILTRYDGTWLSDKDIAETVLHELGHGLGIEGHSPNSADIMYYAVSARQSGHLTQRDANTMAHLYAL